MTTTDDDRCPLCGRVDHHLHDAVEWAASGWGLEWRRASTMLGTPPWLHRPGDGCTPKETAP